MTHTNAMVTAHPHSPEVDAQQLTTCIQACYDCAQTCTSCADACLGEENLIELVRCIRLNLDCADVCETTGRILSRLTEASRGVLRAQLRACASICEICAEECERHESHMEHCRICAKACRECERACGEVLNTLRA